MGYTCLSGKKSVRRDKSIRFYVQISDNKSDNAVLCAEHIWLRERACGKVGITSGFFSIDAGAGKHTYILHESGKVTNVDAEINNLNDINWIEIGYKEGDTFSVNVHSVRV